MILDDKLICGKFIETLKNKTCKFYIDRMHKSYKTTNEPLGFVCSMFCISETGLTRIPLKLTSSNKRLQTRKHL